jgi:thioesterase domain-containing protein
MCHDESILPAELTGLPAANIRQMLLRRYTYIHGQVRYRAAALSIPLHVFSARNTHSDTPLLGWQAALPRHRIRASLVPGDHYSIVSQPNIRVLAEQLNNALRTPADPATCA